MLGGSLPMFHYYNQDHLGNNRSVVRENGYVQQITNYYPFGGVFSTNEAAYTKSPDAQPYKYNGKELDRTHGLDWYDYGARNYDAIVPMFTSIDPKCEKYYNISPYTYCLNNPIMFIDPDGKESMRANGGGNFRMMGIITMVGGTLLVSAGTMYSIATYGAGTVAGGGQLISVGYAAINAGLATYGVGVALDVHESINKPSPIDYNNSTQNAGKKSVDSGKNERHGDGGRTKNRPSTVKQLNELQAKIDQAKGNEKKRLEQKKRRIEKDAQRKERGEEHSRGNKR